MAINFLNTVAVDDSVLFVDTTNNRVGIGTNSPDENLEVEGTGELSFKINNTQYTRSLIITQGGGYSHLKTSHSSGVAINYGQGDAGILSLFNNTTQVVKINANGDSYFNGGDVGIGTTSPSATFVVQPSETSFNLAGLANGQIALGNNTSGGKAPTIGSRTTSTGQPPLQFITGQPNTSTVPGMIFSVREDDNSDFATRASKPAYDFKRFTTSLMSISRDGKVGIGNTSPSAKLEVTGGNVKADEYLYNATDRTSSKNWKFLAAVQAGTYRELGSWRATEGNVVLRITVQSKTPAHSGTAVYMFQGGFNQAADGWYELVPAFKGGGHGNAQDGWKVLWYESTSYTFKIAVAVPTGLNNKNLNVSVEFLGDTEGDGYYQYNALTTTGTIPTYSLERTTSYSNRNLVSSDSITAQYDATNYTVLGYDYLDTYGGNQLFKVAGTERLRIDTSGNATFARKVTTGDDIFVPQNKGIFFNGSDDFSSGIAGTSAGQGVRIFAGGSAKVNIDSSGNVGIGTTGPGSKLDVRGTLRSYESSGNYGQIANGSFQALGAHGGTFMLDLDNTGSADLVNIKKSGTSRFYIENGGNVGIGTTVPTAKLHLEGDAIIEGVLRADNVNLGLGGAIKLKASNTASDQYIAFGTTPSGSNGNATFTEKMRITSGGNVGIGTTSPGEKLEVAGNVKVSGAISIFNGATQVLNIIPSGSNAYINTGTSGGTVQFGAPAQNTTNINVQGLVTAEDINISGGDGYLINGMGFAIESSGVLSLGDWDGNDFQTRIMDQNAAEVLRVNDGKVGIGTTAPASKLQVNGGVQIADDTDAASADKVGTLKYRVSGNNSYVDMCMQTGATSYAWVNIVQNNW